MRLDNMPDALPGTTPKKVVKRVPKGTSPYQAAWIVDSGSDDEDEEYTDEDGDFNMTYEKDELLTHEEGGNESEEEYEEIEVETRTSLNDHILDPEEESRQL